MNRRVQIAFANGVQGRKFPCPTTLYTYSGRGVLIVFVENQGMRNGTETENRDRKQEREQNNVLTLHG